MRRAFDDVSFQLHAGEVLAITGLAGSGKTELGQALFGAWPIDRRSRFAGSISAESLAPAHAVAAGVGFVPEDRQNESLLLDVSVRRNITLAVLPHLAQRWGFLDRSGEQRTAQHQAEMLQIKTPSLASLVRVLSGGNQQKTVLAKWLAAGARGLILLEPTQGIDVGVKFEIYDLIAQAGAIGYGDSLDLLGTLGSGRTGAPCARHARGKIAAEFAGNQTEVGALLRAAAGV